MNLLYKTFIVIILVSILVSLLKIQEKTKNIEQLLTIPDIELPNIEH